MPYPPRAIISLPRVLYSLVRCALARSAHIYRACGTLAYCLNPSRFSLQRGGGFFVCKRLYTTLVDRLRFAKFVYIRQGFRRNRTGPDFVSNGIDRLNAPTSSSRNRISARHSLLSEAEKVCKFDMTATLVWLHAAAWMVPGMLRLMQESLKAMMTLNLSFHSAAQYSTLGP